jgi:putative GTP pyrophosphokinase
MNQQAFIKKYESEKPMYQAWANFVLSKINADIKNHVKTEKEYSDWIKIPPTWRVKSVESLVAKAFVRHKDYYINPYDEIIDKAAIRFVVLLTPQLDDLSEFIETSSIWTIEKSKEYDDWKEKDPRLFDYQSVHYIVRALDDITHDGVIIKKNTPCEIQLRTLLQHAYAELAHDTIYKTNIKTSPDVIRSFAKSMALMETTDELLSNAKNVLEEASSTINEWKAVVNLESENRLTDIELINDDATNDYLLDNLSGLLKKFEVNDFQLFLEDESYHYISEKVTLRANAGKEIMFRHGSILLVYFLSRKCRSTFHRHWPLDREIIAAVYSDLSISPKWPTT